MASYSFTVDGKRVSVNAEPEMPLLYALRNDLGLNNPHFGAVFDATGVRLRRAPLNAERVKAALARA